MISSAAAVWIAVATLLFGGVLSALFFSLQGMTRSRLEDLVVSRHGGGSRRVERILANVDGHSIAVALPRIVCNIITAVASVLWVGGLDGDTKPVVADFIFGVAGSSVLIWLVGLVVPHSVAAYAAEGTVYSWSWLIRACYIVQVPLLSLPGIFRTTLDPSTTMMRGVVVSNILKLGVFIRS